MSSIIERISKLEKLVLETDSPKEKQLKDIKVGDKVKIHRHGNIYVSGKVEKIKGDTIFAASDDDSTSGNYKWGSKDIQFESKLSVKKPLTESFKSKSIAQFIKDLKQSGESKGLPYKLRDVEWSEIPEDKVLFLTPEKVQPYVKPEFVIIWGAKAEKIIQWEAPTYTKYGGKRDNSRKIGPGCIALTTARKFLMSSYGQDKLEIATSNYEIPGNGYMSFLKLRTEIADYALVISLEDLELYRKNYKDKTTSRRSSKEGAIALMKAADIASDNLDRYKAIAKNNKVSFETKEIRQEVNSVLTSLQSKINTIAGTSLLSTKKDYYEATIFELNSSELDKLKELIRAYNGLAGYIAQYLKYANSYGLEHKYSERNKEYLDKSLRDAKKFI